MQLQHANSAGIENLHVCHMFTKCLEVMKSIETRCTM